MKKQIHIIALLLMISAGAKAQKEVLFKIRYMPDQHYAMLMKMTMNMDMNMSGDSATMKQIKASGQTFPMLMVMESTTNGDIKTGRLTSGNKIPYTMTLKAAPAKMTMNGQTMDVPTPATNETLFGNYTPDGKMSIDSIAGKKTDDLLKTTMSKLVENITANIQFPEKPMKIGDTFTQSIPMDMPMAGMAYKINCKAIYKLVSIANNKANFDMRYDISSDVAAGQGMAIKMAGDGDGNFIYDIPANYATSMLSNMNVKYSMTMPQAPTMKMDGKMTMKMDIQTTVSKN